MFNNNKIKVTAYDLYTDKIDSEVVIAHLSDLHEKEFGKGNRHLFESVAALEPDIIAITGDLVAHERQKFADLKYTKALAMGLSEIAPSYFVTGNHERHFHDEIVDTLHENGVTTISEGLHSHIIDGSTINVSGMDDISYLHADVSKSVRVYEDLEGFNVFLAHRPEFFPRYSVSNIDLVLCGHTHAGQIRFPGFGAFVMSGQGFMPKYVQGQHTKSDTTMIISRGLGSSGYPAIRINNPPDLCAIRLKNSRYECLANEGAGA